MAKMCPLDGCKAHQGMCIHDKMMIAMGMMGLLGAAAHWGFHLF
mgnify:CR=1 FL=1